MKPLMKKKLLPFWKKSKKISCLTRHDELEAMNKNGAESENNEIELNWAEKNRMSWNLKKSAST